VGVLLNWHAAAYAVIPGGVFKRDERCAGAGHGEIPDVEWLRKA
jgi:hypothetical protein